MPSFVDLFRMQFAALIAIQISAQTFLLLAGGYPHELRLVVDSRIR